MKPFRWKIFICVLPMVLAAAVVARAWYQYQEGRGGFKLGVDLAGGTILVYEVDPEQKLPDYDVNELVAALKRRIDPADLYNITIRPVGTDRVEVILPTGSRRQVEADEAAWRALLAEAAKEWQPADGKTYNDVPRDQETELIERVRASHPKVTAEDILKLIEQHRARTQRRELTGENVQDIKDLIQRQGRLEFRILANGRDDAAAFQAARKYFENVSKDPKLKEALNTRRLTGKPPPPPENDQGGDTFPGLENAPYSYTWVEIGRDKRHELGLNNAMANEPEGSPLRANWKRAADARAKGEPISIMGDSLLYSWESRDQKEKKYEYFLLTRDPEKDPNDPRKSKAITGEYLTDARAGEQGLRPIVEFTFNNQGAALFQELTSKNKPQGDFRRHLAIVLDGQVVSAPSLNAVISHRGMIEGIPERKEVDKLVAILKSGRLPATLKPVPVSENTIGSTLGEDTVRSGTIAVLLSFLAVMVFMAIYYRFAGAVACVALLANLLLTVAFMVLVNATFTLPGLAGLVLMLGMAVDANVLIYERIREERDRGASLALSIRNGYDRAFPTIIDTHLTSIFTAIVLYVVGNDQLKGFGISLTVGLVISLFTSLYMTRVYFDLALARGWLKKLSMMRLFTRPNINFMAIRHAMFAGTITMAVLGIALFLYRGEKGLNIDFVGGTAYTAQLVELENIEDLRKLLDRQNVKLKVLDVKQLDDPYTFQITYDEDGGKTDVRTVRLPQASTPEEVKERASKLEEYSIQMLFGSAGEFSSGDRSRMFTVLTTERAPELVQTAVSRLLGERLKRINVDYEIVDASAKQPKARLMFTDLKTGEPAYASRARVEMLLGQELRGEGLEAQVRQLLVKGEGQEQVGLFPQMEVTLPEGMSEATVKEVLDGLKKQFADNPQPERLENFDSQLATETRLRALYAVLASWGAILLYLWFRFGNWTFGLAAVVCLIHDLCITLGVIALCHYIDRYVPGLAQALRLQDFKLDLGAVASLLTLVGFSVNDTIVVFDRIREVRGKNPALTPQMVNDSINQTLSRTLLTSLTVWLVVIVLYVWGGAGVHLFAFVMVVGVIVGTFSSIYVASPLLLLLGEGKQPAGARGRATQPAGSPA